MDQTQKAPRLIAIPEVTSITTLHKTTLYQLIKDGVLRPIKLGRKTVFSESEIHDFVMKRIAESRPTVEKDGKDVRGTSQNGEVMSHA